MKKLLKDHFEQFESYVGDISPELKQKVYALEKKRGIIMKRSNSILKRSIAVLSAIVILIITIKVVINHHQPNSNPNNNQPPKTWEIPKNQRLFALSRNGVELIAQALVIAVDEYKESKFPITAFNQPTPTFLSHMNILTSSENELPFDDELEVLETKFEYPFRYVDFYDTFEFYATVEGNNSFTNEFEDTNFRIIVSNLSLYEDELNVGVEEAIIVLINQSGQMISCLTNGASFREEFEILEFSNHKYLEGTTVHKDLEVSPHYYFYLTTNYTDIFELQLNVGNTKDEGTEYQLDFDTIEDSYQLIDDHIMFDLFNLVDRVITVSIVDHPENFVNGVVVIEYMHGNYFCIYTDAIFENGTIDDLQDVEQITIIFNGFFVDDSNDTIAAEKIILHIQDEEPERNDEDEQENELIENKENEGI